MHTSSVSPSLVVQGYGGPADRMHMLRNEKKGLDKENHHLVHENQLLRQTMKARATSMVNNRHKHSKYPQHDRQSYDQVLEKVHNNKAFHMFEGTSMKDLNGSIRKNEGSINKNAHKMKKLDGEYKKNFLNDMKHESQGLWKYFNQTYSGTTGFRASNHDGSQHEASASKPNPQQRGREDNEQKVRNEPKVQKEQSEQKEQKEHKEREDREAKEKQERERRERLERENREQADRDKREKEKKERAEREAKEKEESEKSKKLEEEKKEQEQEKSRGLSKAN